MKTQKTISRILSTAAVAALSMSSLFAQTNLGADCGCPAGELDADRSATLEKLAGELLSNPVIEDFNLTVVE